MILLSAAFTLMWAYLRRHTTLVQPARATDLGKQAAKAAIGIPVYVAATALSFASATGALVAFGVIAIAYAFNRLT